MERIRIGAATALGWLLVLSGVVAGLTTVGDPAMSVLLYFGLWLVSTTLPGVLVWRALARPTTLVQELGFGSALGIALLLLAWLPATLAHRPMLMWLWPAGVVVAFAAVPSLRRHWWPPRPSGGHTPGRWHAAMMLVCGVAFVRLYAITLHVWPLPPTASSSIHQDAWYQLSLTHALGRTVAVQDPSVDGVPLYYHWFANAHVAATQALSGVSMSEVVLHLWLVPMLVTLLFAVAAATERIVQGAGIACALVGRTGSCLARRCAAGGVVLGGAAAARHRQRVHSFELVRGVGAGRGARVRRSWTSCMDSPAGGPGCCCWSCSPWAPGPSRASCPWSPAAGYWS